METTTTEKPATPRRIWGHAEYKHEASGATLYREIAQPHVTDFREVFDQWKPYTLEGTPMKPHAFKPRYLTGQNVASNLYKGCSEIFRGQKQTEKFPDESMAVGPFCSDRDCGKYFSVSCADWVLSRIRERTIIIGSDRMSFELVNHDNGWTLVTANHSCISGSVWLAYIKTSTIP